MPEMVIISGKKKNKIQNLLSGCCAVSIAALINLSSFVETSVSFSFYNRALHEIMSFSFTLTEIL